MAAPPLLLETKLYLPRLPHRLVPRPRLSKRLSSATDAKLLLVSAPAGFGKTTLVTDWLATAQIAPMSVAWLSLDQEDSQPRTFWSYVIAALRTVWPDVGESALALLQAPQPGSIQTTLTRLLNDLADCADHVVLVLDDYHVIDSLEVQEGMAFLLDHLPPRLHLVIAGRADPALPLARLRARGELVEIRAVDMRFTPEEVAVYLNEVMDLELSAGDVEALDGRTEGWIAALQLAALSMQGRGDNSEFIASFAGDDRYIVDYLAEEVLQRQPQQVQTFLLQTSILSRLSGSLCDAVAGQESGRAMLESLDRGNLFLIPLDDRRQWYRYHHLFADVLHARLLDEMPDEVNELHRRASGWFERNGETPEAIRHAMAGADFGRAADLVERAIPATRRSRQEATLRRWLEALPEEVIRVRPVLSNAFAGSRLVRSEVEGVEERLQVVERWLDATAAAEATGTRPAEMVVADEAQFRALPAAIAVHRSGLARLLGDVSASVAHARHALELVSAEDAAGRGAATALLGLAHWSTGDLDAAYRRYSEGMAILEKAGYLSDLVGSAITKADIRIAQGRVREAMSIYERGLELATPPEGPLLRGVADMHVGLSTLLCERNELDAARRHLVASEELGEALGLPKNPYRWRVASAHIRQIEGDLDAAVALLDQAERLYEADYSPDVRPIAALRAQVRLYQRRWPEAISWANERGLSAADELSYLREFEHITLARALMMRSRVERTEPPLAEASGLLQRLLQAAEDGERLGNAIEILVLQALEHEQRGDVVGALAPLARALTLAEPEGYVRVFVDEGQPMRALLTAAADRGIASAYVSRLLGAYGGGAPPAQRTNASLVDPLSERERAVLRLLMTDMAGPEIARELVVSLNTVRTHTKNIYSKLGVNNRRAAVRRAVELGVIGPAAPAGSRLLT